MTSQNDVAPLKRRFKGTVHLQSTEICEQFHVGTTLFFISPCNRNYTDWWTRHEETENHVVQRNKPGIKISVSSSNVTFSHFHDATPSNELLQRVAQTVRASKSKKEFETRDIKRGPTIILWDSIKMNYYHQRLKMIRTECEGRQTGHDSAGRPALWLLEAARCGCKQLFGPEPRSGSERSHPPEVIWIQLVSSNQQRGGRLVSLASIETFCVILTCHSQLRSRTNRTRLNSSTRPVEVMSSAAVD